MCQAASWGEARRCQRTNLTSLSKSCQRCQFGDVAAAVRAKSILPHRAAGAGLFAAPGHFTSKVVRPAAHPAADRQIIAMETGASPQLSGCTFSGLNQPERDELGADCCSAPCCFLIGVLSNYLLASVSPTLTSVRL